MHEHVYNMYMFVQSEWFIFMWRFGLLLNANKVTTNPLKVVLKILIGME